MPSTGFPLTNLASQKVGLYLKRRAIPTVQCLRHFSTSTSTFASPIAQRRAAQRYSARITPRKLSELNEDIEYMGMH